MKPALSLPAWGLALGLLAPTASLAQPVGSVPREELQVLASAFQELQRSLVERPDDRALLISAIKGMVRGADPESGEYFTAEEFERYRQPAQGDAGAIGAHIRSIDKRFILVPLEDSPAAQAGIVFGDEVHAVDGVRVKGLTASAIAKQLSGEPGTPVAITYFRESTLTVHTVQVVRSAFSPRGAYLSRPAPGVVQLRVPYFATSTLKQATQALSDAWRAEPFKALILDLRGCPGGTVESTVGIAALFLPKDAVVVQITGANPESNATYRAAPEFYGWKTGGDPLADVPAQARAVPMAVLIDGATLSGGEIVAASLQDHKRALVIGRPTIGRASIQTIRPLQMGAVKFTTGYWLSPLGRKIQGSGVVPDQLVEDPQDPGTVQSAIARLSK